jgi:NADH-quinone oxidoreductase subunit K
MMTITVTHYIILSAILFFTGAIGVLARRNALVILMSVELMLNAANLALIAFSRSLGDQTGHVIAVFVMTVAACEAAVGLALVLAMFRKHGKVDADEFRALKG